MASRARHSFQPMTTGMPSAIVMAKKMHLRARTPAEAACDSHATCSMPGAYICRWSLYIMVVHEIEKSAAR